MARRQRQSGHRASPVARHRRLVEQRNSTDGESDQVSNAQGPAPKPAGPGLKHSHWWVLIGLSGLLLGVLQRWRLLEVGPRTGRRQKGSDKEPDKTSITHRGWISKCEENICCMKPKLCWTERGQAHGLRRPSWLWPDYSIPKYPVMSQTAKISTDVVPHYFCTIISFRPAVASRLMAVGRQGSATGSPAID